MQHCYEKAKQVKCVQWTEVEPFVEGKIRFIDYYRTPELDGQHTCQTCGRIMHDHGWCDDRQIVVCPGDWVIYSLDETLPLNIIPQKEFQNNWTIVGERKFPFARSRKWINKKRPTTVLKVLPWFQPLDEKSEFDYAGLINDIFPEFSDGAEIYRGTVMQLGWQVLNEHGIWLCMPMSVKEHFKDVGEWPVGEEYHPKKISRKKKTKKRGKK
jgi:hypothetical protein